MGVVSNNISKGGHLVMTDENQYLVWNDPNSSDPTHSMLSKDHFRYKLPPAFVLPSSDGGNPIWCNLLGDEFPTSPIPIAHPLTGG